MMRAKGSRFADDTTVMHGYKILIDKLIEKIPKF